MEGKRWDTLRQKSLKLAKMEARYGWRIPRYFERLSPLLEGNSLKQNQEEIGKIANGVRATGLPALREQAEAGTSLAGSLGYGTAALAAGIYIFYMGETVGSATSEMIIKACGAVVGMGGIGIAVGSLAFFRKILDKLRLKSFIRDAEKLVGEIEGHILGKKG